LAKNYNLGIKLLRERFDNTRTETGFSLSEDAVRLAEADRIAAISASTSDWRSVQFCSDAPRDPF
jgi:hypothetical protein